MLQLGLREDKDCSPDLVLYPTYLRGSDESVDPDDSSENMFDFGCSQVESKRPRSRTILQI